jgi:hypothetical protein
MPREHMLLHGCPGRHGRLYQPLESTCCCMAALAAAAGCVSQICEVQHSAQSNTRSPVANRFHTTVPTR